MNNYYFTELVREKKAEFIGYGNPDAEVLIIGKECAIDPVHDKNIYELSIKKNGEQWLDIINNPDKQDADKIPSWFSSSPLKEKFSPLFPFKGQRNVIEKRDKEGKPISGKEGTSATWYNYQKLIDRIYPDKTKNAEIDFLKYCFITEFSDICSPYSKKSPEVTESIRHRTENILNHPFFTSSFPIIIVACGHYIRQYENVINLQELFGIKWDGHTICVGRNWYNIHKGNSRILIHTNQLSMNISNQLLDKIADECREYKRK